MMKSSKLNVNASSAPATIAGSNCGKLTLTKVRHGVAKRSSDASISVRSIPRMRVRTRTLTIAIVNSECAAITLAVPSPSSGPPPDVKYAIHGLSQSSAVTMKISVAIPMTMPGTMIAT